MGLFCCTPEECSPSSAPVLSLTLSQHRENVQQSHWANIFAEKIIDRTQTLEKIYKDEDGSAFLSPLALPPPHSFSSRKNEIATMGAKGAQLFSEFYDQLRQTREYHRKFPNLVAERPEAEQMLNTFALLFFFLIFDLSLT